MIGDLHLHTTRSDGSCSKEQLFRLAHAAGMGFLAITNHDDLEDFPQFAQSRDLAAQYGLELLHGVEISSYDYRRGRRVHILCYGPQELQLVKRFCDQTAARRMEAGLEMARLVAQRYPVTLEEIREIAGESNSIFKQHIMYALMQAGYATEMYGPLWKELFDFKTGSCIRECIQPDVWEVVRAVRASKGVCVMAHPYTYRSLDVLDELIAAGMLDGIEVWTSKADEKQTEYLLKLAEKHSLIPTGGSDFHGANGSRVSPIGCSPTPEESYRKILEMIEKRWGE